MTTHGIHGRNLGEQVPEPIFDREQSLDTIADIAMMERMGYPGGKGRCYQHIISLMPPHEVYIETHLGGGAVLLRKKPARRSIGVERDPAVVDRWLRERPMRCELVAGDALDFLQTFPFSGAELVYADPPYLPSTRRRSKVYRHDYEETDHVELLNVLRTLPCHVMISGYRSALYDQILESWNSVEFPGDSHVGPTVEVVWMNYDPVGPLHDHAHIGSDFRDRERIRRRRASLKARVQDLSIAERDALFSELAESYPNSLRSALDRLS